MRENRITAFRCDLDWNEIGAAAWVKGNSLSRGSIGEFKDPVELSSSTILYRRIAKHGFFDHRLLFFLLSVAVKVQKRNAMTRDTLETKLS